MADINVSCGFSQYDINSINCGIFHSYPNDLTVVPLKDCKKSVVKHLNRLKTKQKDITEWELIMHRSNLDPLDDKYNNVTVCPAHRYSLGLCWIKSRNCQHPLHEGKGAPNKGINLRYCTEIKMMCAGHFSPIGSGICRGCDAKHRKKLKSLQESYDTPAVLHEAMEMEEQVSTDAPDLSQEIDPENLPSTSGTVTYQVTSSSEASTSTNSPERRQFTLESSWAPTPAPRNVGLAALNSFIIHGNLEPVSGQLLRPLHTVAASTSRYYRRKAREGIDLVLQCLAPGQEEDLLKSINHTTDVTQIDSTIIESLVICYQEADSWYSKRQILSLLVNKMSRQELENIIPGLTKYRFDEARKHAKIHGEGKPIDIQPVKRSKLDMVKADHFLDFIASPEFLQDVAYGTRYLKMTTGEKIEIPNVVRTLISSRLINLYMSYCQEIGVEPLGRSTLYHILQVCSASKKQSVAGLDNIAAEGSEAFRTLEEVVSSLSTCGLDSSWTEDKLSKLKSGKAYLKSDFKIHISRDEPCADHCIVYALCEEGSVDCDHNHDLQCERCDAIRAVCEEIKVTLTNEKFPFRFEDQKDELLHDTEKAISDILRWKSHILRARNQEQAKNDVLETLKENEALFIMDWAMKFLPIRFRETQKDWFGKKGISWHITVMITKRLEGFDINCFVHIVEECTQNWFSVLSILEDTLKEVKRKFPHIDKAYLRSDNAGCYHCGPLLMSISELSKRTSIEILRYDFSEAQAGKDVCDRKIAPMKAHINRYVNEGNNILNGTDMYEALVSYGGTRGCYIVLAKIDTSRQSLKKHSWAGVTSFNNLSFHDGTVTAWKGYNIPKPALFSKKDMSKFGFKEGETKLEHIKPFSQPNVPQGSIQAKPIEDQLEFSCPENGCIKTFHLRSQLEEHLSVGKHITRPLKEGTYDTLRMKWAEKVSEVSATAHPQSTTGGNTYLPGDVVCMPGWALKQTRLAPRYSEDVKKYLLELFQKGANTGRKENPVTVVRHMKNVRNEKGEKRFGKSDWLTSSQITSYFSRLATLQKCGRLGTQTEESDRPDITERLTRYRLRQKLEQEIDL